MFTFSLLYCYTGCAWEYPGSGSLPWGDPSGDSSILLVFLLSLPSKWKRKVAPSVRWLQSCGPDLPVGAAALPACLPGTCRKLLLLQPASRRKTCTSLAVLPFWSVSFQRLQLTCCHGHLTHCEERYACFLELTGALKPFLKRTNLNQSYAHPDKLTLELVNLAQLILQCLVRKRKENQKVGSTLRLAGRPVR